MKPTRFIPVSNFDTLSRLLQPMLSWTGKIYDWTQIAVKFFKVSVIIETRCIGNYRLNVLKLLT